MTAKLQDIAQLGTILAVWAHPDDESWCMGGLLAQASINGQRTVCVTASSGEAGITSNELEWPQARLGSIRKEELGESLQILGVTEHKWLDCKDGEMADMDSTDCVARLKQIIEEVRPDSVFTFGPDGLTGHPDHIAIRDWTMSALAKSSSHAKIYSVVELDEHFQSPVFKRTNEKFNMLYNNKNPVLIKKDEANILYTLNDDTKGKKFRALRAHSSQLERLMKDKDGYDYILSLCEYEAFVLEKS